MSFQSKVRDLFDGADGGFDFLTFIIQLVLAVIGVGIVAGTSGRRAVR